MEVRFKIKTSAAVPPFPSKTEVKVSAKPLQTA